MAFKAAQWKIWVHLHFVLVHLKKKVRLTGATNSKSWSGALNVQAAIPGRCPGWSLYCQIGSRFRFSNSFLNNPLSEIPFALQGMSQVHGDCN